MYETLFGFVQCSTYVLFPVIKAVQTFLERPSTLYTVYIVSRIQCICAHDDKHVDLISTIMIHTKFVIRLLSSFDLIFYEVIKYQGR